MGLMKRRGEERRVKFRDTRQIQYSTVQYSTGLSSIDILDDILDGQAS
jgi:hypothetical protein